MKSAFGTLAAPFPWFGGKSGAVNLVWDAFGEVKNYVEPFCGSAAMLLGAPKGKRICTINDADGFVANFWRAIVADPEAVAIAADWPVNEADLFARHSWLVRQAPGLLDQLHGDPEFYDVKIAGWWCWGACNWIGSGWCSGDGPWVHDGEKIVLGKGSGINKKLPHLGDAGKGINRQLPRLGDAGQGINKKLPRLTGRSGTGLNRKTETPRSEFIQAWFFDLQSSLRETRVTCGDWERVVKESVTTRHGLTGVFLDPPYTKGAMDYAAKGTGGELADAVRAWCQENGDNPLLRIALCGHDGEHDALLSFGWSARKWKARKGYAQTNEARENSKGETVWCSPHCVAEHKTDLFAH